MSDQEHDRDDDDDGECDGWAYDPERVAILRKEFHRANRPRCCMKAAIEWGKYGLDLETSVHLALEGHGELMHWYPPCWPDGEN